MALSTRYSPYTISTPRSMASHITYSPQHFCSEAASISVSGDRISSKYSIPSLSSPNASPLSPSDFISVNDLLEMSYLSDSCYSASDINSPCCSSESMTACDISHVAEETSLFPDPYNSQYCQAGYYSSSSSDLDRYPTGCPQPNAPGQPVMWPAVDGSPGYPTNTAPSNSSMLPLPRIPYSSQDYSFSNFSNMPSSFACATLSESCFLSTSPSFSSHNRPVWSPYPSQPTIGPLPNICTRISPHNHCKPELTPSRALPLIKWFEEHKENPYPTRREKILLCQSTQLTFTQVSTWFSNARRRMKRANSGEDEEYSSSSSSD